MRAVWIASALLATAVGALDAQDGPNFVVILSDDQSWVGSSALMRPGDSRTRSDYFRTPEIERLARRGMTFTDGYAPAPFCCPTRRSLQIGQTPARHLYQADQEAWPATYRRQLNIPRMLKSADARYRTAHFGKWDHRFDRPTPEEMGFDVSDGDTGNGTGGGKGSGGPAAAADPKLARAISSESGPGPVLPSISRCHTTPSTSTSTTAARPSTWSGPGASAGSTTCPSSRR